MAKCQYLQFEDIHEAHEEFMKVVRGEDSRVLHQCITCYGCEEYCPNGNHPFYLICERREERGILPAPRPITNQWINMTQMQGKKMVGAVQDQVLSLCFIPQLGAFGTSLIFRDIAMSFVMGAEFMCPAVHTHFAKMSVVKERLPMVLENFASVGAKEVICMHDECYGTFTSIASAYGLEVPFTPVHYMDYLYGRMLELKDRIRPLSAKVAYQRPCSARLSPQKHERVGQILSLIGCEVAERNYQGENCLCCGEIPKAIWGIPASNDIQKRNIQDMVEAGAQYCVFNCPACQVTLSEKVAKAGLKPVHLIDLCRMALGEMETEE
jgi:Fe-S oxidoreductase